MGLLSVTGSPAAHRWTGKKIWEYDEGGKETKQALEKTAIVSNMTIMYYDSRCYCSKPGKIESLLLQVGVEAFLDVI